MKIETKGGEYYHVNCPFCTDTRKRLDINNLWATDENGQVGKHYLHLAHCQNERCISTREIQLELFDMVFPHGRWLRDAPKPAVVDAEIVPSRTKIALPRGLVSVNHSSKATEAGDYLRQRGFDPSELWQRWWVCYCDHDRNSQPPIRRRIVIPVYAFPAISTNDQDADEPILAGWQARVIESVGDDVPKYLSAKGMRKSALAYGLTAAVDTTGPVVICEGVTDVWRLRTNAVALFGKDLSRRQQRLIVDEFPGRPLVVFLDEDAREKAVEARRQLLMARKTTGDNSPVVIARLPSGRSDVGDCGCDEAWDQITVALRCTRKSLGVDPDHVPPTRHPVEIRRRFKPVRRAAA